MSTPSDSQPSPCIHQPVGNRPDLGQWSSVHMYVRCWVSGRLWMISLRLCSRCIFLYMDVMFSDRELG